MISKRLLFLFLILGTLGMAQNTKDVDMIKNLRYMEDVKDIDCDSTEGTNFEYRVCTNIELQNIDSVMLSKFNSFLKDIENNDFLTKKDSLIAVFKTQQSSWEAKRKSVSRYKSDGYRGHTKGIVFMQSMIFFTRLRINEIEYMHELY